MVWSYFVWISGCILALAWFSRVLDAALGMRKIADISLPQWDRKPVGNPRVTIIVPARNEEADIERTLTNLLALEYDNYEVIAVDDRSTDGTGEIMDGVCGAGIPARESSSSRLKVIHIKTLPPTWLGKTHAMWTAARKATGDWLLFTDADVIFKPDSLRRALAYAESLRADHLVLFPQMIMKSPGERMMIAFFQSLFVFGHRPWKVADPSTDDHMGVGAFNLIRREVYEAIGTYERLRLEVLDDMKLGKVVKNAGYRQRNVFGKDLISLRWAKGTLGVVRNLSKNFFAILSFQWPRTIATCITLAFLNLWPFVGLSLAHGTARIPYLISLFSLFMIYIGMAWKSPIRAYYFLLHPISSAVFIYILVQSTILTLWRGGVIWRGTKYALQDLRRGMV
ncbi:MAG TPA: glycosyltransferase family 2 protein [Terriglobales bacterium]|nr:glycosyltransferase family 2 protein [Terriglobales bacterium]